MLKIAQSQVFRIAPYFRLDAEPPSHPNFSQIHFHLAKLRDIPAAQVLRRFELFSVTLHRISFNHSLKSIDRSIPRSSSDSIKNREGNGFRNCDHTFLFPSEDRHQSLFCNHPVKIRGSSSGLPEGQHPRENHCTSPEALFNQHLMQLILP